MSRILLLTLSLLMLTNCGIRRPLVAPKDQPALEEKKQKRLEKMEEDDGTPPAVISPYLTPPVAPPATPVTPAAVAPAQGK